jgi:hypothetical protein
MGDKRRWTLKVTVPRTFQCRFLSFFGIQASILQLFANVLMEPSNWLQMSCRQVHMLAAPPCHVIHSRISFFVRVTSYGSDRLLLYLSLSV